MSGCKQSIVIYTDLLQHVQKLSLEEAGAVFIAILNYSSTGEMPELSAAADMCFSFIRAQIDRDSEKWENIREKRALSGRIGGVASGESRKQNEANKASASSVKQNEANEAVTVPVPVPVTVPVTVPVKKHKADKPLDEFEAAIEFFKDHRKKLKKPMTDHAVELLKSKLETLAPNDKKQQIALINHAIEKGWQGVYPIDNFKKGDRVEPTEKDYTTSTSAYEIL
jgi:hypothetical protein